MRKQRVERLILEKVERETTKERPRKMGKDGEKVRKERITQHKRKKVMDTTISTLEER